MGLAGVFPSAKNGAGRNGSMTLSHEETLQYDQLTNKLLENALEEYQQYKFQQAFTHLNLSEQWKLIKKKDAIAMYHQKNKRKQKMSSSRHHHTTKREETLLALGDLPGNLDEVMYGIATHNRMSMKVKSCYIHDMVQDGAVLATIHAPKDQDPFRFVGIKYMIKRASNSGFLIRPRDFVFLEATGILQTPSTPGKRLGYHLMHSIDHNNISRNSNMPTSIEGIVRGQLSVCYFYEQVDTNKVDVYMRGNIILESQQEGPSKR